MKAIKIKGTSASGKCRWGSTHIKPGQSLDEVIDNYIYNTLSGFINAATDEQGHTGYFQATESDIKWEVIEELQGHNGSVYVGQTRKENTENPLAFHPPKDVSIEELKRTIRTAREDYKEIRALREQLTKEGLPEEAITNRLNQARTKTEARKAEVEQAKQEIADGAINHLIEVKMGRALFDPQEYYPIVEKFIKPLGNNRVIHIEGIEVIAAVTTEGGFKIVRRRVPKKFAEATQVGDYVELVNDRFVFKD